MAAVPTSARSASPPCGLAALILGLLVGLAGCVPMSGVASLTLMTRDLPKGSGDLEMLTEGPVELSETTTWCAVLLIFGQNPTHESVLKRMLEKYGADVIVDAELENFQMGIPYLFLQLGTTVRGWPARFKKGAP